MALDKFIKDLQKSNLCAECKACGSEFKLSEAVLFDGFGTFPVEALQRKKDLEQELKDLAEKLKIKKKRATEGAERTATAVNIGKSLEKVLPTLKDFNLMLSDCRFLGDPIDLLVFNGITANKVKSINFIEVKSGNARLKPNQRAIKSAVEDKNVTYKEIK